MKKRCFILGAGFSVDAGYPLGKDLLQASKACRQSSRQVTPVPWNWFEHWWQIEAQWLKAFFPQHPVLEAADVELLFTVMDLMARQHQALRDVADRTYRMKAMAGVVAPADAKETWQRLHQHLDDEGEKRLSRARQALGEVVYELLDTLDAKTIGASLPYVKAFATVPHAGDVCIVLNYDLLVERALLDAGRWAVNDGWGTRVRAHRAYGARAPARSEVTVLKPHGSFGWRVRRDERIGMEDHVLQRLDPSIAEAPGFMLSSDRWVDKDVARLDPSYLKPTDHIALRPMWRKAFRALQTSTHWLFCGYSFPPADQAVRTLVGLALADRASRIVTVIDPDKSVPRRVARLVDRDVQHLCCTAADWLVARGGGVAGAVTVTPSEGI